MNPRQYFLKYSFILNLLLIFLIALVISDVGNTYLMHRLVGPAAAGPLSIETPKAGENDYEAPVDEIVSRNLFGAVIKEETEAPDVAAGDTSEIEETSLRLELIGIVYESEDNPLNFATIKNLTEQETDLYRKDSEITANAKVERIEKDRVLLIRNGVLEELRFPNKASAKVTDKPQHVHAARPGNKGRGKGQNRNNDIAEGIEEVAPGEYRLKRDAIKDALAPDNLANILTQARTIPNRKRVEGKTVIDGFRIYRIRPDSVFDKLGLQNGDIIKSINGQYLDNLDTALNMLQTLRTQDKFSLDIERRRREQEFNYQVED